jgi:hypothetical protein
VGALLVLIAYAAALAGKLDQTSLIYLVMNLVGSATLAVLALIGSQWGFLLLEGVWALVSAWSLAQALRGRSPAAHQQ